MIHDRVARWLLIIAAAGIAGGHFAGCSRQGTAVQYGPEVENGLVGFIATSGKVVIPPQFESALSFASGLAAVEIGGRYGFIDGLGDCVIEPQFRNVVVGFADGLAPVCDGVNYGYIDMRGDWVIPPRFAYACGFGEGRAVVSLRVGNGGRGAAGASLPLLADIDSGGDPPAVRKPPDAASGDGSGDAHMIDRMGHVVTTGGHAFIGEMCGGRAAVRESRTYEFVDAGGIPVTSNRFGQARGFSEGLAMVGAEGRCGYIDRGGTWRIAPMFDDACSFHEGRARVRVSNLWGYVDQTGAFVVPPRFTFAYDYSEGLAGVELSGHYGFIDTEGRWVVPPTFDDVELFREGRAAVRLGDDYGFIDRTGKVVIPIVFRDVESFSEGKAAVRWRKAPAAK